MGGIILKIILGVEKTSEGKDVCANICVSMVQVLTKAENGREAQVAVPDYLQSSLYVSNCFNRVWCVLL